MMTNTQPNSRILKSYVWRGDKCFFVSTIERDSSASQGGRYFETLAWDFDWDKQTKGEMIAHAGDGPAFRQHLDVVEQLYSRGFWKSVNDDL
jgi:hypothetical protein